MRREIGARAVRLTARLLPSNLRHTQIDFWEPQLSLHIAIFGLGEEA